MALVLADRVRETCNSPGTGVVALLGAPAGYQRFSVVGNGNTTYYTIADQSGSNWEVGIGTWATGNSLTRTTVLNSSNAGAAVNFNTGIQDVFLTYPTSRSAYVDGTTVTFSNSANLPTTAFNSGTNASSSTYWRGDGTWVAPVTSITAGTGISISASTGAVTISGSGGVTSFVGQTGAVDPTVFGAIGGLVRAYYIVATPAANSNNSFAYTTNYAAGTTVSGGSLAYNVYPVATSSNGTWYASEGMYVVGYVSITGTSVSLAFPANGSRPSASYNYAISSVNTNAFAAQANTFLTYSTLTGSYRSISAFSNSNQYIGGCSQFFPYWTPALWVRYA